LPPQPSVSIGFQSTVEAAASFDIRRSFCLIHGQADHQTPTASSEGATAHRLNQ
jgi:hypothetical protein